MTNSKIDLSFVNEALPQLKEYLLSDELYWPLSASLPRLTPGALALALLRLSVTAPSDSLKLKVQADSLRERWHSAWEKKSEREVTNRMRLWSQYLSDYMNAPDQSPDSYRNEVRGRVILQILLTDLPDGPEKSSLAELDASMKGRFKQGGFIWEPELETVFPRDSFWFLYGSL